MRISQLTYRSAVFARDGYWCSYCSIPLTLGTATVDHVEPLSKGGRNHPDNMVVACRDCNGDKGNLSLIDFLMGEPEPPKPPKPKNEPPTVLGGPVAYARERRVNLRKQILNETMERVKKVRPASRRKLTEIVRPPTLKVLLGEMFPTVFGASCANPMECQ